MFGLNAYLHLGGFRGTNYSRKSRDDCSLIKLYLKSFKREKKYLFQFYNFIKNIRFEISAQK